MVSMVEVMKLDIHASEQDVLTATLAKLQEQEAKTAGEKVERLMHQYRARGLAVVGPQETLEALARSVLRASLLENPNGKRIPSGFWARYARIGRLNDNLWIAASRF